MSLTQKETLILKDSIDDVDVFLSDKSSVEGFDIDAFVLLKTELLKEKYGITDAELTLAFLENIDIANEAGKVLRASVEYKQLRKAKYDLLNQDEMRFDDVTNSTTTWVDAINAIKTAHPKP